MTPHEIAEVARELDCKPFDTAITFAHMIAEYCARIADEHPLVGGVKIREAFLLDLPPLDAPDDA